MSIEAMKLALDCLEDIFGKDKIDVGAINALRQAIADAEKQEPVAWRSWNDKDKFGFWDTKAEAESWCDLDFDSEPLYTTPPPQRTWVGLTDDEISASSKGHMTRIGFARAVEAKLKEKNCG